MMAVFSVETVVHEKDIAKLCFDLELKASKIAGIDVVASDYNLVNLSDWLDVDTQMPEMVAWMQGEYKLDKDSALYLSCLPVKLIALNILLGDYKVTEI